MIISSPIPYFIDILLALKMRAATALKTRAFYSQNESSALKMRAPLVKVKLKR